VPFQVINHQTLKSTPRKIVRPSDADRSERLTTYPMMGDGHGSEPYVMTSLIQDNVMCELPDHVYQRMQTLYFKPPQLTVQAFRDCGHPFTDDQYTELEALLVRNPNLSPLKFREYVARAMSQEDLSQEIKNDDEKRRDQDNALMLRKLGFESLSADGFSALNNAYNQASRLTPDELREFCQLMREHIQFESVGEFILFLGDMFADRGRNAWLMLNLFDIIAESGNYPILHFSNHDWVFFDYLFSVEIEQALKDNVVEGGEDGWLGFLRNLVEDPGAVSPGTWYEQLGESQARSLYQLIECIHSDAYPEVTLKSCRELASRSVLPYLQVMTAVYDRESGAGYIQTHAPVGPETLAALAKSMKVDYDVSDSNAVFKTIKVANAAWREQYLDPEKLTFLPPNELKAQYPEGAQYFMSPMGDIPCPLKYPVLRCAHNRPNESDVAIQRLPFRAASFQFASSPDEVLLAVARVRDEATAVPASLPPRGDGLPARAEKTPSKPEENWFWTHGHEGSISGPGFRAAERDAIRGLEGEAREAASLAFEKAYTRGHPMLSHGKQKINTDASTLGREGSYSGGEPINPDSLNDWRLSASIEGTELTIERDEFPQPRHQEALQASREHTLKWHLAQTFCSFLQKAISEQSVRLTQLSEQIAGCSEHFIPNHPLLAEKRPGDYRDSYSQAGQQFSRIFILIAECAKTLALTAEQQELIRSTLSEVSATKRGETEGSAVTAFLTSAPYKTEATVFQQSMGAIVVEEGFFDVLLKTASEEVPALSEQKQWLLVRVEELFNQKGCSLYQQTGSLDCPSALLSPSRAGGAPPPASAPTSGNSSGPGVAD
jgi:hypothetical protein